MNEISIRQLSQALKWSYTTILIKICRPEFSKFIGGHSNKRTIKIVDLPKVTELLYETMTS